MGSLFLDEITEMPMSLQANVACPTGWVFRQARCENKVEMVVRILAASYFNIEAVAERKLREDLYFEFLQAESAVGARLVFSLIGVPVSQQGFVLSIPGVNIEVARECSSIRSSVMLLVASMVLAQVSLRSPWSKAVVIAATVPLSIAKNTLWIVTLSMLGTRVDPGFLTGRLHHQGGIVFFTISLAVVVMLLWILRRAEERRPPLELNPLKLQQSHLQESELMRNLKCHCGGLIGDARCFDVGEVLCTCFM